MKRLAFTVFAIVVAVASQPALAVDIELLDFESFQSEAAAGETITVSWSGTVKDGDTGGPWTVGIYLSEDVVISPDDDVLLFRYTERYDTESGDFFFEAEEVTIPADTAAGTYAIGAFADDTFSVAETDENNNVERVTLTVTEGGGVTPSVDIDLDDFESFQSVGWHRGRRHDGRAVDGWHLPVGGRKYLHGRCSSLPIYRAVRYRSR
jgi:hypothetical protein